MSDMSVKWPWLKYGLSKNDVVGTGICLFVIT